MSVSENDRVRRITGAFRDSMTISRAGVVVVAVIIGLIVLLMMIPRADTPSSGLKDATRAPVIDHVPRDTAPITPKSTAK